MNRRKDSNEDAVHLNYLSPRIRECILKEKEGSFSIPRGYHFPSHETVTKVRHTVGCTNPGRSYNTITVVGSVLFLARRSLLVAFDLVSR